MWTRGEDGRDEGGGGGGVKQDTVKEWLLEDEKVRRGMYGRGRRGGGALGNGEKRSSRRGGRGNGCRKSWMESKGVAEFENKR